VIDVKRRHGRPSTIETLATWSIGGAVSLFLAVLMLTFIVYPIYRDRLYRTLINLPRRLGRRIPFGVVSRLALHSLLRRVSARSELALNRLDAFRPVPRRLLMNPTRTAGGRHRRR
jgi:hypothetical protein